jgi:2-C-methyl-D-erythritol 4-phosphate cytidylyltransferase
MKKKNVALVLAAGKGLRLGGDKEKALMPLLGKPLLWWTLSVFEAIRRIEAVIVVVPPGREQECHDKIVERYKISKASIATGGAERQDSLLKGFARIEEPCNVVVVHDGARPLITQSTVENAMDAAKQHGAAVVAVPAKDTVKIGDERGLVEQTLDRNRLWLAQTPQAYAYPVIQEALFAAQHDGVYATDESALVERINKPVRIVPGSYENIKITTPEDVVLAEALLNRRIALR